MRMRKIGKLAVFIIAVVGLVACNENGVAPFDAVGDVFVIKKMEGEELVYSKSYFVYGNQTITWAKVVNETDEELDLEEVDDNKLSFALKEEYLPEMPEEGLYQFIVMNEDMEYEDVDELVFEDIQIPTITDITVENERLELEWEAGENDEFHTVRILNDEGELIYLGSLLGSSEDNFVLDQGLGNESWESGYPNIGDTYTLELHAVLFEEGANNRDYLYNIQEIAIAETEIVWE